MSRNIFAFISLFLAVILLLLLYKEATLQRFKIKKPEWKVPVDQVDSQSKLLNRDKTDVHSRHPPYIGQCQRKNIIVTKEECEKYKTSELEDKTMFSFNYVSGAPGSGNDWMLWLASLTRYSWSKMARERHCEAYVGRSQLSRLNKNSKSSCLFFKTHEPWFQQTVRYPARSAFLVRHPYDAIFSEYKRQIVWKAGNKANTMSKKSSTEGLNVEAFIQIETNITAPDWKKRLLHYIPKWLNHATYWLREYSGPLHVLIYNSLKENTTREIEQMQEFFGYNFNGTNFRRHCCVMEDPLNKGLKRAPSEVDKYRDYAYEQEVAIRQQIDDAVKDVQQMLDDKFPTSNYRITRG